MIYSFISAIIFIADSIVKFLVEKKLQLGKVKPIFHGKILLQRFHNTGMMMSFIHQKQKLVKYISLFFTVCMTMLFIFTLGCKGKVLLKTGLAFLLGGAYSNTYDRVRRKYVVDYMKFPVKGKLGDLIFNISDFAIMIGAMCICIGGM